MLVDKCRDKKIMASQFRKGKTTIKTMIFQTRRYPAMKKVKHKTAQKTPAPRPRQC